MTVLSLVVLALGVGIALFFVFIEPLWDVRTVDWQQHAERFAEGFNAFREERDQ